MEYLDLTLSTAEANLALDEALLLEAETGRQGELLRVWEPPSYAVVLGSSCKIADDVIEANCAADGVPILRRTSGGGTVLLGPGCLAFTLILSLERRELLDIHASYQWIMGRIRDALLSRAPGLMLVGMSDLAIGDRKVSGNAQRRMRRYLLHHGTLLVDFDISRIGRYLPIPERQPEYRRDREHQEFMLNLSIDRSWIREALRSEWDAANENVNPPLTAATQLAAEKYSDPAWTRRR